jgi:hypothetical protein
MANKKILVADSRLDDPSLAKAKVITVTVQHQYLIPMHDDKTSTINGWTIDEVIEDWFKNERFPLGFHHASREHFEIGGAKKITGIKVADKPKDMKIARL